MINSGYTTFNYDESMASQYEHRGTHVFQYFHINTTTQVWTTGVGTPYSGGVSEWVESSMIITSANNEEQLRTTLYFNRQYTDHLGNRETDWDIFERTYIWIRVLDTAGGQGGGTI